MNREIKFRIWDSQHKQMLDWSWTNDTFRALLFRNKSAYITMQYTGLKDKNGKEIYEGDILNGRDDCLEYNKSVVEYFSGSFVLMTYYKNKAVAIESRLNEAPNTEYEVLGNIYENLELLKNE